MWKVWRPKKDEQNLVRMWFWIDKDIKNAFENYGNKRWLSLSSMLRVMMIQALENEKEG